VIEMSGYLDWVSLRVACPPRDFRDVLGALADTVVALRAEGGLLRWSYQLKDPGLVVRAQAAPGAVLQVLAGLESPLHHLATAGRVGQVSAEPYEVEEGRFGMPWGVDAFLDDADRDSTAAVALVPVIGVASAWDLVRRVGADRAEEWETWRTVAASFPAPATAEMPAAVEEMAGSAWAMLSEQGAAPPEWGRVATANEVTAASLQSLRRLGLLSVGVRRWTATSVLFRLNRWAVGPAAGDLARLIVEHGRPR
jgi:thiopeptide-type bacteriocin biosynthesis protein